MCSQSCVEFRRPPKILCPRRLLGRRIFRVGQWLSHRGRFSSSLCPPASLRTTPDTDSRPGRAPPFCLARYSARLPELSARRSPALTLTLLLLPLLRRCGSTARSSGRPPASPAPARPPPPRRCMRAAAPMAAATAGRAVPRAAPPRILPRQPPPVPTTAPHLLCSGDDPTPPRPQSHAICPDRRTRTFASGAGRRAGMRRLQRPACERRAAKRSTPRNARRGYQR